MQQQTFHVIMLNSCLHMQQQDGKLVVVFLIEHCQLQTQLVGPNNFRSRGLDLSTPSMWTNAHTDTGSHVMPCQVTLFAGSDLAAHLSRMKTLTILLVKVFENDIYIFD